MIERYEEEEEEEVRGGERPSRSLWVGNMDPTLNEKEVRQVFEDYGMIESIKLLPAKECAFINFVKEEDAMVARDAMQGMPIGNTIMRIGFAKIHQQRHPSHPPYNNNSTSTNININMNSGYPSHSGHLNTHHVDPKKKNILIGKRRENGEEKEKEKEEALPSRALWIGNVNGEWITDELLREYFGRFGELESCRVLLNKKCAFVNFLKVKDALEAKRKMHGMLIRDWILKINFAKVAIVEKSTKKEGMEHEEEKEWEKEKEKNKEDPLEREFHDELQAMNDQERSTLNAKNESDIISKIGILQKKTAFDSTNKYGYEELDKHFKEKMDQPTVPIYQEIEPMLKYSSWMTSSAGIAEPLRDWNYSDITSKKEPTIWETSSGKMNEFGLSHQEISYNTVIPPLHGNLKKLDWHRLKQLRHQIEGPLSMKNLEEILNEYFDQLIELATDHTGNIVFQRFIERSNDSIRLKIIEKFKPDLASIAAHKNGTWVVQKLIGLAKTTMQSQLIMSTLKPYIASLMQDPHGNYVIQSCIHFTNRNQVIFDAMRAHCVAIACSRFGSRAMQACLESEIATKNQKMIVANEIARHAVELCLDIFGHSIVLWLIESDLDGMLYALVPMLVPNIKGLCMNKHAFSIIIGILDKLPLNVCDLIIREIFKEDTLISILRNAGSVLLIRKIFNLVHQDQRVSLSYLLQNPIRILLQEGFHHHLQELALEVKQFAVIELSTERPIGFPNSKQIRSNPSFPPVFEDLKNSTNNWPSNLLVAKSQLGSGHELSESEPLLLDHFGFEFKKSTTLCEPNYKSSEEHNGDPLNQNIQYNTNAPLFSSLGSFVHTKIHPSTSFQTNPMQQLSTQSPLQGLKGNSSYMECPACKTRFSDLTVAEFHIHLEDCTYKAAFVNMDSFS